MLGSIVFIVYIVGFVVIGVFIGVAGVGEKLI